MQSLDNSTGYKVFTIINITGLLLFSLAIILPFMYVITTSVSTGQAGLGSVEMQLWPRNPSLQAYKYILTDERFLSNFSSSVFITVVGTICSMLITSMMAYVVSKDYLPYNRIISFFIYFTVLFHAGLIPLYLVVRSLGLIDSLWAVILPQLVNPWFMILLRNFFAEIPSELQEAAKIDGCKEMGILFRIVLPLSLPALATIGLFYIVFYWNQWFLPLVFINDKMKWTLQVLLREMMTQAMSIEASNQMAGNKLPEEPLRMATLMVTAIPIMCVYPFLQKYFAKGLLIGAVKG